MSKKAILSVLGLFAMCAALAVFAANAEDKKEAEVKCPVSGKAINKEHAVDYKGGKVYFCCPNCPKAFDKDSAKFASKANHQLYVTGQAKLVKCPIGGRPLNTATAIDVGGKKVCFCCENCQGKAKAAEGDAQIDLIFNDKAFAKGFEVAKKEE